MKRETFTSSLHNEKQSTYIYFSGGGEVLKMTTLSTTAATLLIALFI